MCAKIKQEAQNPLILRSHRLMEAFAKSDDERDFYLDRMEGFIIYVDLDKPDIDLESLEEELSEHSDRYCLIPKLTFYETKKIMEGFVNEKVYDIDTKEKLLDIIQSKEARENFLDFIYDQHAEMEKWQQYYQERSRVRIIEWLRNNHFHFVFEEDLDLPRNLIEKLKQSLFDPKAGKEIQTARKVLLTKAKTYYSNEALNPRPKRGRPPKQAVKQEVEPQMTTDIYTTVTVKIRPFLFTPDITGLSMSTFSSKFDNEDTLLGQKRTPASSTDMSLENWSQKLASLRSLSNSWMEKEGTKKATSDNAKIDFDDEEDFDEDEDDEDIDEKVIKKAKLKKTAPAKAPLKSKSPSKASSKPAPAKKAAKPAKPAKPAKLTKPAKPEKKAKVKRIMPRTSAPTAKGAGNSKNRPLKKIMKPAAVIKTTKK